MAGIPLVKPIRPREVTATNEEFEKVFREACPMLQLAMLLAREAGLRHATLLRLTRNNCDFEKRVISGKTKAQTNYMVPMTKRLYERLLFACAGAVDNEEPLIRQYNKARKQPHENTLTAALWRAKRRANLATTKWGLHDLRRTAARALFERTLDIRKVQGFLGHMNPQQSWWYIGNAAQQLTQEDMEGASSESAERRIA